MQVQSLGWEDPLQEGMTTHSSILAWRIPWTTTYDFAANVNQCHKWLDDAIMRHDASYRYSRRRLAVLRSVYSRGINQYSYSYVTNAINELVAYPEANLPD